MDCGSVLWQNPKPSVQALIVRGSGNDAEILLGRQQAGPGKGLWDAPGGFLNLDDEPRAALVRECQREFGVQVRVCQPIGAFPDSFAGGEIAIFYRCEVDAGEPAACDLVDAVAWFPVGAPPTVAFESTKAAVKALRNILQVN
jgi:ADP-ribose pyrophosphatase YjhB (NUDIX family)